MACPGAGHQLMSMSLLQQQHACSATQVSPLPNVRSMLQMLIILSSWPHLMPMYEICSGARGGKSPSGRKSE
jgi:hypothetical protein